MENKVSVNAVFEVDEAGKFNHVLICAADDGAAAVVQGAIERFSRPSAFQWLKGLFVKSGNQSGTMARLQPASKKDS